MVHKIRVEGNFVRERIEDPKALRVLGYRFRTKVQGGHRLIFAVPQGQRRRGGAVLQAILHPLREAYDGTFRCRNGVCRRLAIG